MRRDSPWQTYTHSFELTHLTLSVCQGSERGAYTPPVELTHLQLSTPHSVSYQTSYRLSVLDILPNVNPISLYILQ